MQHASKRAPGMERRDYPGVYRRLGHRDPGFTPATCVHLLNKGLSNGGSGECSRAPTAARTWFRCGMSNPGLQLGSPAMLASREPFSVNDGRR